MNDGNEIQKLNLHHSLAIIYIIQHMHTLANPLPHILKITRPPIEVSDSVSKTPTISGIVDF